jgi:hypothetical protein
MLGVARFPEGACGAAQALALLRCGLRVRLAPLWGRELNTQGDGVERNCARTWQGVGIRSRAARRVDARGRSPAGAAVVPPTDPGNVVPPTDPGNEDVYER